jgi:KDO2-lipid IV(A) lauroyltransferase
VRRWRFLFEAAVFRFLLAVSRLLPRGALLGLGALAGRLGAIVDRRHRRIAEENLRRAYGGTLAQDEITRIVTHCWSHFGSVLMDSLAFPRFSAQSHGSLVRYRGLEHIRGAYARGKGVLLFSGHYGHWELVALMQGYLGLPLALVTRPLDNPYLERMLADLRARSGNVIIHKRRAVREMVRALHAGSGVAIVIDQDAREGGVFVPFFGIPASTTPTLALLALRTGAAVVPVFSTPEPDGAYEITYGPEVQVNVTGDRDADVVRLTAACTSVLEQWVRRRPELWLWMHRRWKTAPPARQS